MQSFRVTLVTDCDLGQTIADAERRGGGLVRRDSAEVDSSLEHFA